MRLHAVAVGFAALLCAAGCAQSAKQEEAPAELGPELQSLVLDDVPSDVPNRTLIDFGGKVSLIGYSIEPMALAAPGSKLSLKLFWRCDAKLTDGYALYTELVTAGGKRFDVDGGGPLRKGGALTPSSWQPGKIYIDELDIAVPNELDAARFSVVAGVKTAPIAVEQPEAAATAKADEKAAKTEESAEGSFGPVYLNVISGPAEAKHGGVIATLETGVTPATKRARNAKGAGALKRPAAKPPLGKPGQAPNPPRPAAP